MRPGDLLRAVAFVSVPLAWWHAGFASGACLFLVCGGVMGIRWLGWRPVADVMACLVLPAVAWAAVTGLYEVVPGLDLVAHVVGTAVATGAVLDAMRRVDPRAGAGPWWLRAVLLVGLAALLSVLWEVGEWLGHHLVDDTIRVGYDDTVTDLLAGLVGGGALAFLPARSGSGPSAPSAREAR
ncbi:hypothetical protein [Kytococcus sedentarius]|uniref:hypothetical protein n=1 Tax=Kytococcus sedentarius TaxID=1276 RepID=UPI0035BBB804